MDSWPKQEYIVSLIVSERSRDLFGGKTKSTQWNGGQNRAKSHELDQN